MMKTAIKRMEVMKTQKSQMTALIVSGRSEASDWISEDSGFDSMSSEEEEDAGNREDGFWSDEDEFEFEDNGDIFRAPRYGGLPREPDEHQRPPPPQQPDQHQQPPQHPGCFEEEEDRSKKPTPSMTTSDEERYPPKRQKTSSEHCSGDAPPSTSGLGSSANGRWERCWGGRC